MSMFMFNIVFAVVFTVVVAVFIAVAVRGLSQWKKNNNSPRLTVDAEVVSKRTRVSHSGDADDFSSTTNYYITFQFASGDRLELHVGGREFGLIVEGDRGSLTFQGTRFIDFQRKI